jgi:hypothetical protein
MSTDTEKQKTRSRSRSRSRERMSAFQTPEKKKHRSRSGSPKRATPAAMPGSPQASPLERCYTNVRSRLPDSAALLSSSLPKGKNDDDDEYYTEFRGWWKSDNKWAYSKDYETDDVKVISTLLLNDLRDLGDIASIAVVKRFMSIEGNVTAHIWIWDVAAKKRLVSLVDDEWSEDVSFDTNMQTYIEDAESSAREALRANGIVASPLKRCNADVRSRFPQYNKEYRASPLKRCYADLRSRFPEYNGEYRTTTAALFSSTTTTIVTSDGGNNSSSKENTVSLTATVNSAAASSSSISISSASTTTTTKGNHIVSNTNDDDKYYDDVDSESDRDGGASPEY